MGPRYEQNSDTRVGIPGNHPQDVIIDVAVVDQEAVSYDNETNDYEYEDLGGYEPKMLPIDTVIGFSQVRGKPNKEIPRLIKSIDRRGVMTPINVIRMNDESFMEYIKFINGVWKTDASFEDYESQRDEDGYFYVLFGGHTRLECAKAVQAKRQQENPGKKYRIPSNVHVASSFEEIMDLQIEDNIHSGLSKEEEAVLVVEMFRYGVQEGRWGSKAEFRRKMAEDGNKKISEGVLNNAIQFADLPPEIREAVFSKKIPYAAGVQLGRESDVVKAYAFAKLGLDEKSPEEISDQDIVEAEVQYRLELVRMVNTIYDQRLNNPAALKHIEGRVKPMKDLLNPPEQPKAGPSQESMFDTMFSPEDTAREYRARLIRDIQAQEEEVEYRSIQAVEDLIRYRLNANPEGDVEELRREYEARVRRFGRATMDLPSVAA